MRTARSLTVSRRIPRIPLLPPCTPPCTPSQQPHMPPTATMPPPQPHMPPYNHACPPTTHPPRNHTCPPVYHACPPGQNHRCLRKYNLAPTLLRVVNIIVSLRLRVQNAVSAQPCVGKFRISLVLLNFLHCNFRLWFETP